MEEFNTLNISIAKICITTYPFISWIIIKSTQKKIELRKKLLFIFAATSLIIILGIYTNISATSNTTDLLLLSLVYFTISFIIQLFYFHRWLIIKIIAILSMIFLYGIAFFYVSPLGFLSLTFEFESREPHTIKKLGNRLILKTKDKGNPMAFSDPQIEIYKTSPVFPFIERKFFTKKYDSDLSNTIDSANVIFEEKEKMVTLRYKNWSDTIRLGN